MTTKSSVGELTGLAGLHTNGSDYATDLYLSDKAVITPDMREYIPALEAAEICYAKRSDNVSIAILSNIREELARIGNVAT